jgi:hypothetical protein
MSESAQRFTGPVMGTRLVYVSNAAAVWGVLFAVVHAYWASGGEIGMKGGAARTVAAQGYIAVIALLGLIGAVVAYGLAHGPRARPRRGLLILLARAAGAALLLGVAVGTGRWLADWSLDGDGAAGVVITLYFLLGGVLFSMLGWQTGRPTSPRPPRNPLGGRNDEQLTNSYARDERGSCQ